MGEPCADELRRLFAAHRAERNLIPREAVFNGAWQGFQKSLLPEILIHTEHLHRTRQQPAEFGNKTSDALHRCALFMEEIQIIENEHQRPDAGGDAAEFHHPFARPGLAGRTGRHHVHAAMGK